MTAIHDVMKNKLRTGN